MKKRILTIMLAAAIAGGLCACGNTQTTEEATRESGSDEELTSVDLSDLNDYISMSSSIYIVQGTDVNKITSFWYDSDVIEEVNLDTSEVDTDHVSSASGDKYDVVYTIDVNVEELCEKENLTNGMTDDTVQLSGTLVVTVITKDYADEIVENGANSEAIIGYN